MAVGGVLALTMAMLLLLDNRRRLPLIAPFALPLILLVVLFWTDPATLNSPPPPSELDDIQEMIHLNITSLTEMTNYFLINMKKENYGRILNVASVASFQPGPLMSVYSATKHYVLAFSEAIAEELRKDNISITTLCPGPTISGFQKRAGFHKSSRLFKSPLTATSREVAVFGYKKMMAGKRIVIPGLSNKISTTLVKFIPSILKTRMVKKVFDFMH